MQFVLNKIRAFYRDTRGTMVVEFVIMLPLLTTLLVAMVVYFDAFRTKSVNLKAAYTLSDMISREVPIIDGDYVDGLKIVFDFLVESPQPTWIRVSLIQFDTGDVDNPGDSSDDRYFVRWSDATDGEPVHTDATIAAIKGDIPIMPHGDSVLIVESHMKYFPAFNVGLDPIDLDNRIVTRPRFAPPCWEDCNS